jgi:hypothetical protein
MYTPWSCALRTLGAVVMMSHDCGAVLGSPEHRLMGQTSRISLNALRHERPLAFSASPSYNLHSESVHNRYHSQRRVPICPFRASPAPLARRVLSQPTVFVTDQGPLQSSPSVILPRSDKPPYAMNTQQLVYVWLCRQASLSRVFFGASPATAGGT